MKVLLGFLAIFALCVQSASAIENDPIPGAVIAVQTFGDFLGFNPHCHILVTDGCFYGDGGMFRVAPLLELKKLEAIFQHKVETFSATSLFFEESLNDFQENGGKNSPKLSTILLDACSLTDHAIVPPGGALHRTPPCTRRESSFCEKDGE